METFIKKYQIKDLSLCDDLIEYHKNNIEHKVDEGIPSTLHRGIVSPTQEKYITTGWFNFI